MIDISTISVTRNCAALFSPNWCRLTATAAAATCSYRSHSLMASDVDTYSSDSIVLKAFIFRTDQLRFSLIVFHSTIVQSIIHWDRIIQRLLAIRVEFGALVEIRDCQGCKHRILGDKIKVFILDLHSCWKIPEKLCNLRIDFLSILFWLSRVFSVIISAICAYLSFL